MTFTATSKKSQFTLSPAPGVNALHNTNCESNFCHSSKNILLEIIIACMLPKGVVGGFHPNTLAQTTISENSAGFYTLIMFHHLSTLQDKQR